VKLESRQLKILSRQVKVRTQEKLSESQLVKFWSRQDGVMSRKLKVRQTDGGQDQTGADRRRSGADK
jgi:hypothetical protein